MATRSTPAWVRADPPLGQPQDRAIALPGFVRLPRSGKRRGVCWLKLLTGVNHSAAGGFAFEGRVLKPGGEIPRHELPEPCVLLECAGAQGGRGHSRADCLYILWQYCSGEWRELARAQSVGVEWVETLKPAAERALQIRKPMGIALDATAIAEHVLLTLDWGLRGTSAETAREALGIIHDRLVAKVAGG